MKAVRTPSIERRDCRKQVQSFPFANIHTSLTQHKFHYLKALQTLKQNINHHAKKQQQDGKLQQKEYHDNKKQAKSPNTNISETELGK